MFAIGDKEWPGISKLTEEMGEALQTIGKLIGSGGSTEHWDGGEDLKVRLENELADTLAAIEFVSRNCKLDQSRMRQRVEMKMARFDRWHELGATNQRLVSTSLCNGWYVDEQGAQRYCHEHEGCGLQDCRFHP